MCYGRMQQLQMCNGRMQQFFNSRRAFQRFQRVNYRITRTKWRQLSIDYELQPWLII